MQAPTDRQRGSLRLVLQTIKTETLKGFVESTKKSVIKRPKRLSASLSLTGADDPSLVLEGPTRLITLTKGSDGVYRDLVFSPSEAVRHYWVDEDGH